MFMTANGSRSVLVPLHGHQAFGLTTTVMGAPRRLRGRAWPNVAGFACPLLCAFHRAAVSVASIAHALLPHQVAS